MPKVRAPECRPFYAAAKQFVDLALRDDDSLFTPSRAIWSPTNLLDLHKRFIGQPDDSGDNFLTKFRRQLSNAPPDLVRPSAAPPDTIQFAAELLYVHLLIAYDIGGPAKRNLIRTVLGWSPAPVSIPADLDAALDRGIASTGVAFKTLRPFQLRLLLEFVQSLKDLPQVQRARTLDDPWAFREMLFSMPLHGAQTQREALLYLVHPDTFEPIVSRDAKQRIVAAFRQHVDNPSADVDQQLAQIRRELAERHGPDFNFYDQRLKRIWQPPTDGWGWFIHWVERFYRTADFERNERDFKFATAERLVRAREALLARADDWHALLKRAFGAPSNLTNWRLHDRFLKWCSADPAAGQAALRALWDSTAPIPERLRSFDRLIPQEVFRGTRLPIPAVLLMAIDPEQYPPYRYTPFHKGFELTGYPPPAADLDPSARYEHMLGFLDRLAKEASDRGLELRDRMDAQGVLWAVTQEDPRAEWTEQEQQAFLRYRGDLPPDPDPEPPAGDGPTSRDPLGDLAETLFLDRGARAHLEKWGRLLKAKRQIIFYGPPGTGKTYTARELARHYADHDPRRVVIVQFHSSYAYEDFVEGYRPKPGSGQSGFSLVEGPLKRLARLARENPGACHVLLIDEINRGNVAKVFGELYYLLEYRREKVQLQYSEEPFELPDNLWIIGTMNSADRSIALIDAALRRRFYFVGFFPDQPPVQGLLRAWLGKHRPELSWVADVVERANEQLDDRHAAIGPSYFLGPDLDDEWIAVIWEHAILPYLAEQFFGEEHRLQDFQLERLRQLVDGGVHAHPDAAGTGADGSNENSATG